MHKIRIIRFVLILLLLLPLVAFAETQEVKKYKVIKGDTLWDVSEKEWKDPFMWPKIWKENSGIANPHWIYPGQVIKIPLYLIQKEKREKEAVPEVVSEVASEPETVSQEPVKGEVKKEALRTVKYPLVKKNILVASGYIAETIPGVGRIVDSISGQTILGNEDIVFVTVDHPAKVGDKFYVVKASAPVRHPITGKKIGYVIAIAGEAEIVKIKNGETMAKITKCFRDIDRGDRLESYYDIEIPITTGHFRSPDIKGMIVATGNNMKFQSMLDIIYIDKGCKDGIEVGDMFMTIAVDAHALPNGVIKVISCRDHTATAIIEHSSTPVFPGNIFVTLDKVSL